MASYISLAKKMAPAVFLPFLFSSKEAEGFFWGKSTKEPDPKLSDKGSVYFWGNGFYQARPDSKTQFTNFCPKKITLAERIDQTQQISEVIPKFTEVRFNHKNGFGLDISGSIWAFENRKIPSFVDSADRSNFIVHDKNQVNKDNVLNQLKNLKTKRKIRKITLTKRFLWALADSGHLYSLPLDELEKQGPPEKLGWKELTSIKDLKDISAGSNHLLMLKDNGEVYSMGSDTFGQCGLGEIGRSAGGSFIKTKVPNPQLIEALKGRKIARVFAKGDRSFVVSENKDVYAFGSNSKLQLAHEKEYSDINNPTLAFFTPVNFTSYLETNKCDLQDIVLGSETSFFVCLNKESKTTQVFGCGLNANGQLADGRTKHITDFEKIEYLSDYTVQTPEGEKPMGFRKMVCGDNHCMALTSFGALLIWGDNEYGQLGNRKRSYSTKPLIVTAFKEKNVIDIAADFNSNYVWAD